MGKWWQDDHQPYGNEEPNARICGDSLPKHTGFEFDGIFYFVDINSKAIDPY